MNFYAMFIVSREALLRHSLACLLSSFPGCREVAEYKAAQEVLNRAKPITDSILILDAGLPEHDISAVIDFARQGQNRIILLSSGTDKKRLVGLMPLKADGYITTRITSGEFFALLDKVKTAGETVIDESLVSEMAKHLSAAPAGFAGAGAGLDILTPREVEVLRLLAVGYTNRQIAKKLVISVYTVKNHVHSILDKLDLDNRTRLTSYAHARGLVG